MRRKIIYIIVTLLVLYCIAWIMNLTPIVMDFASEEEKSLNIAIGDSLNPIGEFDFDKGNWEMYIKYSISDLYSDTPLLKGRVFKCSEREVLKDIQSNLWVRYSGADMTTADSKIYLFKDGVLKFVSGVVADKNSCGIQSMNYGWVSSPILKTLFHKFEKVNSPLVVFK